MSKDVGLEAGLDQEVVTVVAQEIAIVRQEVERSRSELLERIDRLEGHGGPVERGGDGLGITETMGGWLAVFAVAALAFSVIMALAQSMDVWAGALIVAGCFAALCAAALVAERLLGIDVSEAVRRTLRTGDGPLAPDSSDGQKWSRRVTELRPTGAAAGSNGGDSHGHGMGTTTLIGRAETRRLARERIGQPQGLQGEGIVVNFGGVRAVDDVSIRLAPGERLGIVGANGAGKTTLFNALTGFVPLDQGRVSLGSQDITGWPSFVRARAGIRRTFQKPRLSDTLTMEQNIGVGHRDIPQAQWNERVGFLLERFHLADKRGVPVGALPFGQRREVEVMRALTRTPHVLMLDEPASGLEGPEVEGLLETLMELQADEGWGLIVIEHDLQFITTLVQNLMVMEDGILIMEGPTHDVLTDRRVRRIYLGEAVGA
jgi:branched-chain amino acid transport system ATP-binding protein